MPKQYKEYMKEYMKKYRETLKTQKRCLYCRSQDGDTLSGRSLCHKCAVKRLGHEPRVLIPREKKPPVGIPRKEWYQYGWCNRCRGPLSKQSSIYLDRPMRVCDKCYEVILEIGRKRTLDAKKRGSKWVN